VEIATVEDTDCNKGPSGGIADTGDSKSLTEEGYKYFFIQKQKISMENIEEITTEEYIKLIDFAIEHKKNILVFGPPGIGKTDIPEQRAEVAGMNHFNINFSVLDAPDVIGVPLINKTTKQTEYCPPDFLPKKGRNLMVGDEIDKLKPEIQSPLLSLFRYKMINKIEYAIDTIIATANEPDDGAFSLPISTALTNRCMVYRLKPDFKTWKEWALVNNVHPLVISFLIKGPDNWLTKQTIDDTYNYAFATPRTWVDVSNNLNALEKSSKKELTINDDKIDRFVSLLLAGSVGSKTKNELSIWLSLYKKIDPYVTEIMDKGFVNNNDNLEEDSKMMICLRAIQQSKVIYDDKKISNIFTYLSNAKTDYSLMAYKSTFSRDPKNKDIKKLEKFPEFKKFRKLIIDKMETMKD
jgi:hypothetical protein